METLLLSHIIWSQFFINNAPLFCVNLHCICCESDGILVGEQLLSPLPSKCVQQFWLGCAFPVPSFLGSSQDLAAGDTGQQVTREQEMMPLKPLPVVLVAAAEGAGVNIINPNPSSLTVYCLSFLCLFFFSFKDCVQNMRFVSLSWVFLLALDVSLI